jgi:Leucine-rich repeat (LRR) protein
MTANEEIAKILGVNGAPTNTIKESVPDILPTLQAKSAENAVIESLRKLNIDINPIASASPFLQVKMNQSLTDQQLDALQQIAEQITWLDLKRTNIADNQLVKLQNFKNLTQLRLELTAITDAGLKNLETLTNLQYLNLYGTKVSNAGLKSLGQFSHLRSVYLWQTNVTPEGARELQAIRPRLKIDLGLDKMTLDSLITKKL